MGLSVVTIAILPDQIHVSYKLLRLPIAVVGQSLFYCSQIHWLSHYIVVVHNIEFSNINRLKEIVGSL